MRRLMLISFHTCPLSPPGVLDAGGLNVYVLQLARELGRLGWTVDIYTRCHRARERKIVSLNSRVRVIHLKVGALNLSKNRLTNYTDEFAREILQMINSEGLTYDYLYAHYYLSGLTAEVLSAKLGIPFVITFHTLGILKKIYAGEVNQERVSAEKKLGQAARLIIVSTELEKRALQKYYGVSAAKIAVVVQGVESKIFHPRPRLKSREKLGLPEARGIILFVGRIDPIKGISNLIRAVSTLSKNYPEFEHNFLVLLVGGNTRSRKFWQSPEVQRIKRLIEKDNLSCCVKFLGAKPHNQLADYYAAADVVVLPSFYESFGLVVLEALASGAAVLASKVGGLRFLVEDNKTGLLFASRNQRQLADKLWCLLKDQNLREKLGARAAREVKKYQWSVQAEQIANLLNQRLK